MHYNMQTFSQISLPNTPASSPIIITGRLCPIQSSDNDGCRTEAESTVQTVKKCNLRLNLSSSQFFPNSPYNEVFILPYIIETTREFTFR